MVEYEGRGERVQAVRGVSFDVHAGEVVALVGESGSGKSTTAHAVVGLLPGGGRVVGGSVRLHDGELVGLPAKAWQQVRGARIGLVPQDPGIALNPVTRIGDQVAEVLRIHGRVRRAAAAQQAVEILRSVGLSDPEARARQYPHELSGGMRQRVLIGIALAARARPGDRRRADQRARRHGAAPRARPARRPHVAHRLGRPVHHARPGGGGRPRRPGRGDEGRRDRRAGTHGAGARRAQPPVHAVPAGGRAAARGPRAGRSAGAARGGVAAARGPVGQQDVPRCPVTRVARSRPSTT